MFPLFVYLLTEILIFKKYQIKLIEYLSNCLDRPDIRFFSRILPGVFNQIFSLSDYESAAEAAEATDTDNDLSFEGETERENVVYVLICVSCAGVGIPAGVVSGVSDLLENLNIKDNTADIETALESLKLQVSGECRDTLVFLRNESFRKHTERFPSSHVFFLLRSN